MSVKVADLQKAAVKKLVKHFKKAEAHHKGHAEDDEKCEMAHKAHAEAHEKKMGKGDDSDDYHKASAAFHKSLAKFAERMKKRETEYAEHNKAMAEAVDEKDNDKAFKLLGVELTEEEKSEMSKAEETPTPAAVAAPATPAATPTPVAAAATPAPVSDFNEQIAKTLEVKLAEAVEEAFKRVLNSDGFNQKVDQAIASKMLEKLGTAAAPSEIKTFPVPRTQENKGANGTVPAFNISSVPLELQDMVKID